MRIGGVNIKINILETKENYIKVSTPYGEMKCQHDNKLNNESSSFDVEIEVSKILEWGIDIRKASIKKCSFNIVDGKTAMTGLVDSVDDDGILILRVDNSVVVFETKGRPYSKGEYITIEIHEMEIFDVNL